MTELTTSSESLNAQIGAAVEARRGDLIALLQDLVRIPSENPKLATTSPQGESNSQDRVVEFMTGLGIAVDRWDALPGRPNVVGTMAGTGGGRSLAFNAHIDTVPAGDPSLWTHAPFAGDVADGCLWGRGAIDAKGGVASFLMVAQILRDLGFHLRGDIFFQAVVDEETGGPGTAATVERGYLPDFAIVVDAAEPVASITPVEGGLEWLRLTVTGVSGHSAMRYRSVHAGGQGTAVSAFDKGVKLVNAIADLERMWANRKVHPLLPAGITTINVGAMTAGTGGGSNGMPNVRTSVSALPDYCAIDLSLKYLPTETAEEVRAEFETFIHHVCQTDDWLRDHPPTIEWGLHGVSFPPANTAVDHPGVVLLAETVSGFGGEPKIGAFSAVSDIAWLAGAGVPAVLCGPGLGFNAHGVDERIDIESLMEGVKVLTAFAIAWCGVPEGTEV